MAMASVKIQLHLTHDQSGTAYVLKLPPRPSLIAHLAKHLEIIAPNLKVDRGIVGLVTTIQRMRLELDELERLGPQALLSAAADRARTPIELSILEAAAVHGRKKTERMAQAAFLREPDVPAALQEYTKLLEQAARDAGVRPRHANYRDMEGGKRVFVDDEGYVVVVFEEDGSANGGSALTCYRGNGDTPMRRRANACDKFLERVSNSRDRGERAAVHDPDQWEHK